MAAAWELYAMPSWMSMSANPMTPSPTFLLFLGHCGDFGQRVIVHFDDIVKEPDRRADRIAELKVIYFGFAVLGGDHMRKVDRSEVARLVGQQGLFAAGIGRFDGADMRGGVFRIDPVEENDAGLAVFP